MALLLLGSGLCALVYQLVWLRELRLIFGASTPASAASLAIFMGGLGAGSFLIGPRADRHHRPLALYGRLEIGIALSAALTPLLLLGASRAYAMTGGAPDIGIALATPVRLLLASLVLGVPTVLMGGTLPAAARAVVSRSDDARRSLALLYGANTLGAVLGAFLSTFVAIEILGLRTTLWTACALNLVVGVVALLAAGRAAGAELPEPDADAARERGDPTAGAAPVPFVLAAACTVGFVFFLLEMVWYRMLAPLLGGSTFTFGLILALVLAGVGAGGLLYASGKRRREATLERLAFTCALEAALVALPFALGDRLAVLTLLLGDLGSVTFAARVFTWSLVTTIVVVPPAIVAGYQFPLLVALLGRGRRAVGRHVGLAYGLNTVGAIAGALAGGFGLMSLLGAPTTWRVATVLLLLVSFGALVSARRSLARSVPVVLAVTAAAMFVVAPGPSAAWRHVAIGAGRAALPDVSRNGIREWRNQVERSTLWEREGRESAVALQSTLGYSFIINGKSDGSARYDAPTQVMCGLLGALLRPDPERVAVIGLGTGSTAGWLGDVASVARVDVAELEPAILQVARDCAPVNRNVLENPKVHVTIADAREMLTTTSSRFDLIVSEPSNPYRAGVASLFTRDFYEAAAARLAHDGVFVQWMQAYEVDSRTVASVYATVVSVFPEVDTWQTGVGDLLLICSRVPRIVDAAELRIAIAEEPFATALARVWRVVTLEGVLARHVADSRIARVLAASDAARTSTDDLPHVEFGYARSVGRRGLFSVEEVRHVAKAHGADRPHWLTGEVDWRVVEDERIAMYTMEQEPPPIGKHLDRDAARRARAMRAYLSGDPTTAVTAWQAQSRGPRGLVETVVVGDLLASSGADEVIPYIERFRSVSAAEADVLSGIYLWKRDRRAEAATMLVRALETYRTDPWPWPALMGRAVAVAQEIASEDSTTTQRLYEALREPFALMLLEEVRARAAVNVGRMLGPEACAEAIAALEPYVPWDARLLTQRVWAYDATGDPRAERARRELREYRANEPQPLDGDRPASGVE